MLDLKFQTAEAARQSTDLINAEKNIAKLNVFKNENKNNAIAYELHENIAQIIAAAKMKIEAIQNPSTFSMQEIIEVKEYLSMILNDVIKLSNSVTPTTFKSAEYLDYIERMINNFKKSYNVNINFTVEGSTVKFKSTVGLAFYRIIQYQLYYAHLTEATIISINIINKENVILLFEHNGKYEYCESLDADLYLNNINTQADVINASFKNDLPNKKMEIIYKLTSPDKFNL